MAKWKTDNFLYKELTRLNILLSDEIQSDCDIFAQRRIASFLLEDINVSAGPVPVM